MAYHSRQNPSCRFHSYPRNWWFSTFYIQIDSIWKYYSSCSMQYWLIPHSNQRYVSLRKCPLAFYHSWSILPLAWHVWYLAASHVKRKNSIVTQQRKEYLIPDKYNKLPITVKLVRMTKLLPLHSKTCREGRSIPSIWIKKSTTFEDSITFILLISCITIKGTCTKLQMC